VATVPSALAAGAAPKRIRRRRPVPQVRQQTGLLCCSSCLRACGR
jgi:hypothetical protein